MPAISARRFSARGRALVAAAAVTALLAACVPPVTPTPTPPPPVGSGALAPPFNPNAAFTVEARTNPPGSARFGLYVSLELRASADVFAHAYVVEPAGTVIAIAENVPLARGRSVWLPDDRGAYLVAAPPAGTETFIVLATVAPITPLALSGAGALHPVPLNQTGRELVAWLGQRVAALPSGAWSSTVTQLAVGP